MSSDPITTEQRNGIHERGRKRGRHEGISSGVNQLVGYLSLIERDSLPVQALEIGMQAKEEVSANCRKRFLEVDWLAHGIIALEDMTVADDDTIARTQPTRERGGELIAAIDLAMPVFNLRREAPAPVDE